VQQAVIALDIGGTKLSTGTVLGDGRIISACTVPCVAAAGGEALIAQVIEQIQQQLAQNSAAVEVVAIGVGTPGQIDYTRGKVSFATTSLPGWHEIAIIERIRLAVGIDAYLDNDGNLAALGEARFGAGLGCATMICMTIGTGIGGGLVINGQLHRGMSGSAGGLGHICVMEDGADCYCGHQGCVELYASGKGIAAQARAMVAQTDKDKLPAADTIIATDVFTAASHGDGVAQKVISQAVDALSRALITLVNIINPEKIIVTGGVAMAVGDALLQPLRHKVLNSCLPGARNGLEIVLGQLEGNSGLLGAAALAWDECRNGSGEGRWRSV
jgi:glucokinase